MRFIRYKIIMSFLVCFTIMNSVKNVYGFDFPKMDNKYVQDNAKIISVDLKNKISSKFDMYLQKKDIDGLLVTIDSSVGEKQVYTKQLKEWWGIGDKDNGFIIAIYPKSKDQVVIMIDDSLKDYLSSNDLKDYENEIKDGLSNNTIDESIERIILDMDKKLDGYTKKDTIMQNFKDFFKTFSFTLETDSTVIDTIFKIEKYSNKITDV